jgi:hypothetical protein
MKTFSKHIYSALLCILATGTFFNATAQKTVTFSHPNSAKWIVPVGVTSIDVELWGAGGGGGSVAGNKPGAGGGGGAYSSKTLTVTPGDSIYFVVGRGGVGAMGVRAGENGGLSSFGTLTADGGFAASGNVAGAGAAAGSSGNTNHSGAFGGNAADVSDNGGGGGGASGNSGADGLPGSANTGANGGSGGVGANGGGSGGNGGNLNETGIFGAQPGGGGGGEGGTGAAGSDQAADGGDGQINIIFSCSTAFGLNTTAASDTCANNVVHISVSSNAASLPVGSYLVTYDLSGANTVTGSTALMTVETAGVGSFYTYTLLNAGSTTITITSLMSGGGGGNEGCSSILSSGNTAPFNVTNAPIPTFLESPSATTALNTTVVYTTQSGQSNYVWVIPGKKNVDYMLISPLKITASTYSISLQWKRGGAKRVQVNYTSIGCSGALPASSLTSVPEVIYSGAFIVDMGQPTQTIGNGLKPYGMIYDLIKNYSVPVRWVINQSKVADGVDFQYNGTDYKGGTFIILPEFRNPEVNSRIAYWQGLGVIGETTTTDFTIDYSMSLNSYPRWAINSHNGQIPQRYLSNAGINLTDFPDAYYFSDANSLGDCDDLFIMPHAYPTWAEHGNLINWNINFKGSIWASCISGSLIENLVNPADKSQQTNFLSVKDPSVDLTTLYSAGGPTPGLDYTSGNSLKLWYNHQNATPPYIHFLPTNPISQFIGTIDTSQTVGSEQIYVPRQKGGVARWRPGAQIISYDPTQNDVTDLKPDLRNAAVAILYGRGFDDPNRGYVMYEAGHDHASIEDGPHVAGQRAFFNYSFSQANDKVPSLSSSSQTSDRILISGALNTSFHVIATSPVGSTLSYQWTSSVDGGSFTNPNGSSTSYTAPEVTENTDCYITCMVTDNCGRQSFMSYTGIIYPPDALPVSLTKFTAKATPQNTVSLSWTTTSESNNDGFMVERQSQGDNGKYEAIGFVKTKALYGKSTNQLNYAFVDPKVHQNEVVYYRLAQIDLDGKTMYSEIRFVKFGTTSVTMIFPNPSQGSVNISRTPDGKKMSIQVIDQLGRIVNRVDGITDPTYRLDNLKNGIYTIKLIYPETGAQTLQKIIVQK